MQYLYTNNPDDGCHVVAPGVYGRPVHGHERGFLLHNGWKKTPEEINAPDVQVSNLALRYEERFGEKPHHRMKPETILKALQDDQAATGNQNTDFAGD